jgi:two-component system chemotaxis sensor kinase CheA
MSSQYDRAQLAAFHEDVSEIVNEWESVCLRASSSPSWEVFEKLMRCAHNLKGNAGLMGFEELAQAMHRLEDRLSELGSAKADPTDATLMGILLEIEKSIRIWLNEILNNPAFAPENFNVISKLEAWSSGVQLGEGSTAPPVAAALEQGGFGNESVRIAANKLDQLIQLVGELILAQAIVSRGRVEDCLDTPLVKDAVMLCEKLVRSLRMTVLDMRMLPMSVLYNKLERAGMEVSIILKKPIHLLFEGQEVSVDKAVLNRIFDPLLHILRNGIDHGLEPSEERVAKGKAPVGTVIVSASIEPSGVCIRIRDDGRGLDVAKIRAKAIERGLIQPQDEISEDRMTNMIFEPGFSTAAKLTSISGRGVGLDVVKKEVITLGGQVDVHSKPGEGTEFVLILPVSISLIDVLVVENRGQMYCVPTQDIAEVLDGSELKFQRSAAYHCMIDYRDRILPIEPVEKFLRQVGQEFTTPSSDPGYVLVVSYQDQLLGIRVDAITHQQQVFVRTLKGYMANLPCLTGSTILSNGEPSLIINVKEMANNFFLAQNRQAVRGFEEVGKVGKDNL